MKNHVRFVLSLLGASAEYKPSGDEVSRVLRSRSKIAAQLLFCGGLSSLEHREHVTRLASFTFFVLPLLPKLRGVLSAMDSPPLDAWIRHAALLIQLLTLCFTRDAEQATS